MLSRKTHQPIELAGYQLPVGTNLLLSPYALHRREDLWPNPAQFDPNRFQADKVKQLHRSAYIPFGAGPRVCIGSHFALMEGTLVLATIIQNVKLSLANNNNIEAKPFATIRPSERILMNFKRR